VAELILGPILRYLSAREATVWVETDIPCTVEILGHSAASFQVAGKHYGLVVISGLDPASSVEYEVHLNGERRWPATASGFPASRIQTLPERGPLEIAFGSCRVTAPNEPPFTLTPDQDERGIGVDALQALALRLRDRDPDEWPRLLLLIGDQVYADEVSPGTLELIRGRRDLNSPPGEEVLDLDEYAWLYREAWSPPALRWLLSTIPTAMIFDDHDVHDDWNISDSWVREMRAKPWWLERIVAALSSYWVYQHLGNLSPAELQEDDLYQQVLRAEDAEPLLREFALAADREEGGSLWSFSRDVAGSRLLVIDSREGRVLESGHRQMLDEQEWRWAEERMSGSFNHILLVSTLPVLLPPAVHYLEAWSEAVCDGAWGRRCVSLGEKLRRGLDLEHWAAFQESFHRLINLLGQVASGRRGAAPASIVLLGGDVHQAYVDEVTFKHRNDVRSRVYQAVCSPFRHPLSTHERAAFSLARRSRALTLLVRRAARAANVTEPEIDWKMLQQPTFENQVGRLRIDGRSLWLTLEQVGSDGVPELQVSFERQLV
jgi:PhoD-like phosphatase